MADKKLHQVAHILGLKGLTFTTGTWTDNTNATVPYFSKAAAAESPVITIPIKPPILTGELGVQLDKIDVPLRISTADLTGVITGALSLINHSKAVAAAGVNIDTTAVTITEAGTQVTNAATDRLYTATIAVPALSFTSALPVSSWVLNLTIPCATTTVLRVYEPIVYFTSAQ